MPSSGDRLFVLAGSARPEHSTSSQAASMSWAMSRESSSINDLQLPTMLVRGRLSDVAEEHAQELQELSPTPE